MVGAAATLSGVTVGTLLRLVNLFSLKSQNSEQLSRWLSLCLS